MQVTTIVGAQAAYACIKTSDVSLDVRLEPGKSAQASLRQWAAEQVTTAERLRRNASLALAAAMQLEHGSSGDSTRKRPYRCTDCGHIQQVTQVLCDGHVYAGSGANWCDECESGKPEPIPLEDVEAAPGQLPSTNESHSGVAP
jgi:hypothetical protein